MYKIIIFSHESDIDGLGSIVLSKIAFKNFDYELFPNPEKLELAFRKYIENNKLDKYDKIFITDLSLSEPSLTMVANSNLKDKVLVFDHHIQAIIDNLNRYSFTKIIEKENNIKTCGTELFYKYLIDNKFIKKKKIIDTFVEYTRLEDTWEWKQKDTKAHDLAILFNSIGIDKYIDIMTNKLLNNYKFTYTKEERKIINNKKKEYNQILKKYIKETEYFYDEYNNKYGIVYANYEYRNEIAESFKKNNKYNIKYIIIVALDKGEYGQKSYRSVLENFDVNFIANIHGGGGHPSAAAVNISKEQKEIALSLNKKEGLKYLAESKYNE